MNNLNPDNLTDDQVEKLLPLWKDYINLSQIIPSNLKGINLILDWICSSIEFKLKKATIYSLKKNFTQVLSNN